jgi:hypothetical protein
MKISKISLQTIEHFIKFPKTKESLTKGPEKLKNYKTFHEKLT